MKVIFILMMSIGSITDTPQEDALNGKGYGQTAVDPHFQNKILPVGTIAMSRARGALSPCQPSVREEIKNAAVGNSCRKDGGGLSSRLVRNA